LVEDLGGCVRKRQSDRWISLFECPHDRLSLTQTKHGSIHFNAHPRQVIIHRQTLISSKKTYAAGAYLFCQRPGYRALDTRAAEIREYVISQREVQ
jgi:hypothetical protein